MSRPAPLSLRNGQGRLARKPWTAIGRPFNTCSAEQPEWLYGCRGSNPPILGRRHLARQSRAYTKDQVEFICSKLSRRSALATRIDYAAGLRGHELYSLKRRSERAPSAHRKWSKDRFFGRVGIVYTVKGKCGLVREVIIPTQLAKELELRRLPEPVTLRNRGINHQQHYDITAGQSFSHIFTKASVKNLGWPTGAHGLRHGYAQVRMDELHTGKFTRQERMEIVSQELGHFRPDIVKAYLRLIVEDLFRNGSSLLYTTVFLYNNCYTL